MLRTRLLPIVVVAALGLAGCGSEGTGALGDDAPVPAGPTDAPATVEATVSDGPVRGEPGDNPIPDDTDTPVVPGTPDAAEGGPVATPDEDAPVVLAFDGNPVPLDRSCLGADEAIVVHTDDGVTVSLVREEGVAMRYQAEDTTAETDEVAVDESEDDTVYTATLSSEQVQPLAVTMTVADDAMTNLEAC